jgi:hypothetical protein
MTEKELRLTKGIHNLVRGNLSWEESWELLSEVVESIEWIEHLEIEILMVQFFEQTPSS